MSRMKPARRWPVIRHLRAHLAVKVQRHAERWARLSIGYEARTIDIPDAIGDDGKTDAMVKAFSVRVNEDENG